ncbi:MAG: Asp-tRNA(Asn)/Glu-tRNA(Gln) amidotransferase GatCAB subunit B, partial [Chloroflexota bacterium]|nr:Asp-tRNA(Asn)/Glu-tRNA(Gln) amidotransferase GatCAB subunit B [Chloroflexota bacterium]
ALRCDANVSLRPVGQEEYGAKVEIKNLNSFRMIERAIAYELGRQQELLESGGTVVQETRGWDETSGTTLAQRTKEYASDYRYFPEPDLPPLTMSQARREEVLSRLAELPDARRERFVSQYALSPADAEVLTASRDTADYFEAVVACLDASVAPRTAGNWISGELFRLLKQDRISPGESRVSSVMLAELLGMLQAGEVSPPSGRVVLEEMYASGRSPRELAAERGLTQISDTDTLVPIVRSVLERNPKAVNEYRGGKAQVVAFLMGQVMRETKGAAKADTVRTVLQEELAR